MTPTETRALLTTALELLEDLLNEAVARAVERHSPQPAPLKQLWLNSGEATKLMGAAFHKKRLIELGHQGKIIMQHKEPDNPKSEWIFNRASLLVYSELLVEKAEQRTKRLTAFVKEAA